MKVDATQALQIENEFLAGVAAKLTGAQGRHLRGTIWRTSRHDDGDTLRALMAAERIFDRERLKHMPANRRVCMHGYERRWWFGKRKTGVAIAATLVPLKPLIGSPDGPAPPVELGDLVDHVRKLVTDPKVPHVIGVCCPSGVADEVRNAKLDLPNVTLVVIEPKDEGGWQISAPDDDLPEWVAAMFDPEDADEKVARVRLEIERRSADLLTGGLSASSIANRLDLPQEMVGKALEGVSNADPELRTTRRGAEVLLFRGAPVRRQESNSMNVLDRLRQLLSKEGDEVGKINLLSERRAALAQRRDRMYEDIAQLETKEADLLAQGRANQSQVVRRRLAAQLAQLRKDIDRANTTANMLNQQINIISTDIHNLTLIQQGEMASLPNTEELTENAVKAEEMLETLKADADLVSGLETGLSEMTTGQEELDILAEFDAPIGSASKADAAPAESASDPPRTTPTPERSKPEPAAFETPGTEKPASEPKSTERARPADPEAT